MQLAELFPPALRQRQVASHAREWAWFTQVSLSARWVWFGTLTRAWFHTLVGPFRSYPTIAPALRYNSRSALDQYSYVRDMRRQEADASR